MSKFSINVSLSYSKIIALLILLSGIGLSFVLKDSGVFIATITTVMAIIANKQYQDRKTNNKSSIEVH